MTTSTDSRQFRRAVLSMEQGLRGSRALRPGDDVFSKHPITALASGVALTPLSLQLLPTVQGSSEELQNLFKTISQRGSYGFLVGWDVPDLVSTLMSDRYVDEGRSVLSKLESWGDTLCNGGDPPQFLDQVSSAAGEKLAGILLPSAENDCVPAEQVGRRAAELFMRSVAIAGNSLDEVIDVDYSGAITKGLIELTVMSATAHLFRTKAIRYEHIGDPDLIRDLINPIRWEENFLKESMDLLKKMPPIVRPLDIFRSVHCGWGKAIKPGYDEIVRRVVAFSKGFNQRSVDVKSTGGAALVH